MHRRRFLQATALLITAPNFTWASQATAPNQRQFNKWIELAEKLKPKLHVTRVPPVGLVRSFVDEARFLRWRIEPAGPATSLQERLMRAGDSVLLDFGTHLTGHFSIRISGEGRGIDAPTRLRFTFGEVPAEVSVPLDTYKGGLSRAWLQDEVVNIDVLPATIRLPRRYSFRYAKVDVIATSPNFGVRLHDPEAAALTSAGPNQQPLPPGTTEKLRRIDDASLRTLRECMQTVFEDGPKRDRRLWIGDLRLQALTNYVTFRNYKLVKRCLYLFAGLPREDGLVPACVFEDPRPLRGHEYIIDYAALYAPTVLDYARAANDWAAARELWPVVRRQMELLSGYVGADGLFAAPKGSWVFIDWRDGLDRTAAMHGVFVYSLRQALELARVADAKAEVRQYSELLARTSAAARKSFLNSESGVFVSGPNRQVSWATQAWMVLSQIATPEEAQRALKAVRSVPDAVRPGGPYLYHYFVEAMLHCGMKAEALKLLQSYWGGMVDAGADTFWEVYDPSDPQLSPYGDALVNSYCHAWSCTPAWLLRAGKLV